MKIIKLDAIGSTNTFLKELAQNSHPENYTVVVTNHQYSGRGQVHNRWVSSPFKNLTFSIFTRFNNLLIEHQSYLNFAVSLAIYDTLKTMSVPNLSIKWPNDIMSGNQKLCGILVETTFKQHSIKNTVIGIGLNVNQENFPAYIPNATSLKKVVGQSFDLDEIMNCIVVNIQEYLKNLENQKRKNIYKEYLEKLYKKGIPTAFKNEKNQSLFMGIILGVSREGKLQIQLEDDSEVEFDIKEISLAKA